MIGVEISNEGQPARGRVWVPYVNAHREEWSYICENNRVVSPDDEIVFRYEQAFQSPSSVGGGTSSAINSLQIVSESLSSGNSNQRSDGQVPPSSVTVHVNNK